MKKAFYWCWLAWAIACVVAKCFGWCGWAFMLSPIWIPLCVVVCFAFMLIVISDFGSWMKRKSDDKLPDSCENCLFKKSCDLINSTKKEGEELEKCMGEKFGAAVVDGKCEYYTRYHE